MKSILLLLLLGALAVAQIPASVCQCPQVKCPGDDSVKLCQCLNSRESLCKNRCPDYVPTYLPCPAKPTSTPVPAPPVPSANAACECETQFCAQLWPESCYCGNANKQACFEQCGGVKPALQACPPLETPILITTTSPTPTTTRKPTASTTRRPVGTHAACGGNRSNYTSCTQSNYVCIKDPYRPGCGPECDGLGICVEDRMCGGFAGFPCPSLGQVCTDDPRDGDDCDPKLGAADCAGVCVWPH
ncbi:hypothetical protein P280DRAFT_446947 [Massarina eburnea CBS 473.64]|uniref:Uncharacterized protein n=1 Tax=Massarina eburnea CBS 473.64 TaxID=1395130 RepID=A0A6A6S734_9PLEO|nr:hypothetical protein P280DRAFT_446947 [Massarina eburnea CBS 473.64]